jgi:hypothetical protein
MKLLITLHVHLYKTIDVPDSLWATANDPNYDDTDALNDHISDSLPLVNGGGWDDFEVDDEEYYEVKDTEVKG